MSVDEITLEALALKIEFLENKVITDVEEWGEQMVRIDSKLDKILPLVEAIIPRIQTLETKMQDTKPWISAEAKAELLAELKVIKEKWEEKMAKES